MGAFATDIEESRLFSLVTDDDDMLKRNGERLIFVYIEKSIVMLEASHSLDIKIQGGLLQRHKINS